MNKMKLEIKRYEVQLHPSIEIFHVSIEVLIKEGDGVWWEETIPTEENLYWFHRGLQAGYFPGTVPLLEIPKETELFPPRESE